MRSGRVEAMVGSFHHRRARSCAWIARQSPQPSSDVRVSREAHVRRLSSYPPPAAADPGAHSCTWARLRLHVATAIFSVVTTSLDGHVTIEVSGRQYSGDYTLDGDILTVTL